MTAKNTPPNDLVECDVCPNLTEAFWNDDLDGVYCPSCVVDQQALMDEASAAPAPPLTPHDVMKMVAERAGHPFRSGAKPYKDKKFSFVSRGCQMCGCDQREVLNVGYWTYSDGETVTTVYAKTDVDFDAIHALAVDFGADDKEA